MNLEHGDLIYSYLCQDIQGEISKSVSFPKDEDYEEQKIQPAPMITKQSSEFMISEIDEKGYNNELERAFKDPTQENVTICIQRFDKSNSHYNEEEIKLFLYEILSLGKDDMGPKI